MINEDKMKVFADRFNNEIYPTIEKLGIYNLEKHVEQRKKEVKDRKSTINEDEFTKEELELMSQVRKLEAENRLDLNKNFAPLEALEFLNDLDISEIEEMFNSLGDE